MVRQCTLGAFVILAVAAAVAPAASGAYAQLEVVSETVGTSVILNVKNTADLAVQSFSVWLDSGEIRSYKAGNNWVASKNSAGILLFTATTPLEPGQSAQFGIKADDENPEINWSAFYTSGVLAGSGTLSGISEPEIPVGDTGGDADGDTAGGTLGDDVPAPADSAISDNTNFRIVPDRPNVGATIRMVANGIAPGGVVDFYIGAQLAGTYEASPEGTIVETAQIPSQAGAERTDFVILDSEDNRKKINIRLGEHRAVIGEQDIRSISIAGPTEVHPSEVVTFSGTAAQNSHIVVSVARPDGIYTESKIMGADVAGGWSYDVIVPENSPTGSYTITATNGRISESRVFAVSDTKAIEISPTRLKFEPGDVMTFIGTVQPGHPVEVLITDPRNREVHSEVIRPDLEGRVRIEFETNHSDLEGTYALLVTQNSATAVVLGGLGEFAKDNIVLHADKLNYRSSESMNVFIDAESNTHVTIIVLDSSNKNKYEKHVEIGPSGKTNHLINLNTYATGVYTLVATKATAESEVEFGVNIAYGSGSIEIKTTKSEYVPGSAILILGEISTTTPVLLSLSLIDPDGNAVRSKDVFSSGATKGKIYDDSFRIPADAKLGAWTVLAQSGSTNMDGADFSVIASMESGRQIRTSVLEDQSPRQVKITGVNIIDQRSVHLTITPEGSDEILGELDAMLTLRGSFEAYWKVPDGLQAGTYAVRTNSSEPASLFELE